MKLSDIFDGNIILTCDCILVCLVYDTNVFGLIDLTQLALPLLRKYHGRIVMVSSIAGFFGMPNLNSYHTSSIIQIIYP